MLNFISHREGSDNNSLSVIILLSHWSECTWVSIMTALPLYIDFGLTSKLPAYCHIFGNGKVLVELTELI